MPVLQLTGHAVELSLKAFLASRGIEPPHGHDLLALYKQVEGENCKLEKPTIAALVHLCHHYFRDLSTGTTFKMRYPTKTDERVGGAVPENAVYTSLVESILLLASQG